jgi:two-component system response regulator YesN
MYRVLLVDDEEIALVSLHRSLPWEEYGFTDIITTTDPQWALTCLKEQQIDAAFVDIRMPGINGLELIASAKQSNINTFFVIASGYSDFSLAQKAIQLGALDYCLKPITVEDTSATLERLSSCVLSQRLSQDPERISSLLLDSAVCEVWLKSFLNDHTCENITMLYVRCTELMDFLKSADKLSPYQVLFNSSKEALLFWSFSEQFEENAYLDFLESFSSSALMISCSFEASAEAFQSSINHLFMDVHNRRERETGLVQLSTGSPEMAMYFASVLAYVEAHYNEKLTLSDLSHQFGINYSYLSQLFRKHTRKSFSEYLTHLRLSYACRLLTETKTKISLISEQVGFSDYHYFCNVFKRTFSVSPMQYRNQGLHQKELNNNETA